MGHGIKSTITTISNPLRKLFKFCLGTVFCPKKICWLAGKLAGWLASWLADWLAGKVAGWQAGCGYLSVCLSFFLFVSLFVCFLSKFVIFRSATGENWHIIMLACGDGAVCDERAGKEPNESCGSPMNYVFFISFIFFCSFLVSAIKLSYISLILWVLHSNLFRHLLFLTPSIKAPNITELSRDFFNLYRRLYELFVIG